jgi:ribosomal protein S18 acetylase RimI-like enzyme
MTALEHRARTLGFTETHLDTATNQPEAIAFYRSIGYQETGRAHEVAWTLVYFTKALSHP